MTDNRQPTFEEVEKQEARAAALEQQAEELAARESDLTKKIAESHATGVGEVDALTRERREVRELRADVLESLPLVRKQVAKDREQAGKVEAKKRTRGISRAYGSLAQELNDDEARLKEAAVAYTAAADRLNERYRSLARLKAEAAALGDRFGVAAPTFAPVVIPAMREGCGEAVRIVDSVRFLDHAYVRQATEHDEHNLLTRRTYREIKGTDGYRIITVAGGPQPWPELTAKQREIVASRPADYFAPGATNLLEAFVVASVAMRELAPKIAADPGDKDLAEAFRRYSAVAATLNSSQTSR